MVPAEILVALGLAPRDAERSDQRAGISLVLVREQQLASAAIQLAAIAGKFVERSEMAARASPLLDETGAMLGERIGERLIQSSHGAIQLAAEAEPERERVALAQIDFGGPRDSGVERRGGHVSHT